MRMKLPQIKDELRVNILFASLQCFFWSANCIYFSFLVLYLTANNYSSAMIGLIMMVLSIVTIITPSIIGYISDFYIPIKKCVAVCLFASVPTAFLLKASLNVVPLAFFSIICMGVLEKGLVSVIDSWGVKIRSKKPYLNYGVTRGLASLVYAGVALIFGRVFEAIGLDSLFYIHGVFAFTAACAAVFLDNIDIKKLKDSSGKRESYFDVLKSLFKNPSYVLLILAMTCSGVGLVSTYTFQPMLISEMGGTTTHLGMALFFMAASEVPVMFNYNKISKKFSVKFLLWVSFFFMILRIFSHVVAPNLTWLIGFQTIQALSFGLYLPSVLLYIAEIAPTEYKATAITFAVACNDGLAGIIGNAMGGYIAETFGLVMVFIVFGVIAIIGFLIFTYSLFVRR